MKRVMGGQVLYSHVVAVEERRMIFIAGQLARDRDGNILGKGDMRAQILQVGENLKTALAAAGATLNNLDEFFRHAHVRTASSVRTASKTSIGVRVPRGSLVMVVTFPRTERATGRRRPKLPAGQRGHPPTTLNQPGTMRLKCSRICEYFGVV
jgi:2-iminobutanoate/2-iminopropanoate deaminase